MILGLIRGSRQALNEARYCTEVASPSFIDDFLLFCRQMTEPDPILNKRRMIAGVATLIGAIFVELPDWIPLLDEALVLFLIHRIWQWAGVDLSTFLRGVRKGIGQRKQGSKIIEVD